MRRLLAALALGALFVARPAPAAPPNYYVVTWTLHIVEDGRLYNRSLSGLGGVSIWTYAPRAAGEAPPPDGELLLYHLEVPLTCAGKVRCVIASLPLPDPDVLRRLIIYSWVPDDWQFDDAMADLQATVTKVSGPI